MAYSAVILADAPLGYWPLDEPNNVGTVSDHSGHAHTGTLHGGAQLEQPGASALLGPSMFFASGGTFIAVPSLDGHLPVGGDPYTIECWCKLADPAGSYNGAFVFWGDYTSGGAGPYHFNTLLDDGVGNLRAAWQGNGTGTWTYSLTSALDFSTWHHVGVTCDGTTEALYVDGTQVATHALYSVAFLGHNFTIGAFTGGDWVLRGSLQHVAVYTTALSRERMALHYAAGCPYQSAVLADAPAAYWPLSESTGLVYADVGAAGYSVSAPAAPVAGVSGPLSTTKAVRFRRGGAVWGTESGLDTQPPFTIDAWINIAGASDPLGYNEAQPILFWGDPTYRWATGAEDRVEFTFSADAPGSGMSLNLNTSWFGLGMGLTGTSITGAWHHVAMTWNNTTHTITAYVDGASAGSFTYDPAWFGTPFATPASGEFMIGGFSGRDTLGWCDIAYVALYPSVLTSTRIAAHHSATTDSAYRAAVLADAPSAFWPLQEV